MARYALRIYWVVGIQRINADYVSPSTLISTSSGIATKSTGLTNSLGDRTKDIDLLKFHTHRHISR